ncbi:MULTISPECIES: ABC transporter permease [Myxococcaceae]|uniref:ABC transporter permease n=1 Tax=Myxococcaceae TaxID=31 RepID=UPI00188EEDAB|nr:MULTISPECIES: ABC transporter permease [Myxococcaceae]MBF5046051.1 ABC transporter permease [Simulacricoccus sp. 17bor-14]
MESLLQDLRYAGRSLRRSPGFTLAAVLTLGLALGANTVLFSAVHALLFEPLPFPQPEQLVRVFDVQANEREASVSEAEALAWMEDTTAVQAVTAITRGSVNRTGGELPERLANARVTPSFFRAVGAPLAAGRGFEPGEERAGAAPVAVIAHPLATRLFGSPEAAVGQSVWLDGVPTRVLGVMREGFFLGDSGREAQVWQPLDLNATGEEVRGHHYLTVLARLKPGVSEARAREVLSARSRQVWEGQLSAGEPMHGAWAVSWQAYATRNARPVLLSLWAASGFVLLIAAANVANLLLARALGRRREGAIRAALGASRRRQVQAALVESVLLSAMGGVLGLLLALWGTDVMRGALNMPAGAPGPSVQLPIVLFAAALCLGVGVLFGLAPALETTRGPLLPVLGASGTGYTGARHPLRAALVVVQLALAVVLLAGTGLMLRTLSALADVRLGFEPEGAVATALQLPKARYADAASRQAAWDRVLSAAASLPGVQAAGLVESLHLGGSTTRTSFGLNGAEDDGSRVAEYRSASPGAFAALKVPLRQGRLFTQADRAGSPPVAVVNEAFVRKYLAGQSPLGARLAIYEGEPPREVVGVVGDVRHVSLTQEPAPAIYVPVLQTGNAGSYLLLRAAPAPTLAQVREVLRQVDPELPVERLEPLGDTVARARNRQATMMRLMGGLSVLALALATLGVWGVVSYGVRQRTRELSIRRALGAPSGAVVRLVVGGAARLVGLALLAGLPAAVALALGLRSLLYGVKPLDVPTLLAVALLMSAVGLAAAWVPARRAARVDPGLALKGE